MPDMDAIALVVANMRMALGFYRLLGFDIPPNADNQEYVSIDLGEGRCFVLNTEKVERSFNPEWSLLALGRRMVITLRCASAAEVDAVCQSITDAGFEVGLAPFDAPWGSRHCRVFDPDGNTIDLFAPMP